MIDLIVHLGIILILFYFLTKVVDQYFLSSLENISTWLRLPPSIAGVTLLAVGTSAPELGTAMFSLLLEDPNPGLGAGTIVGSAIFQLLVVVGFTAFIAKSAQLNRKTVLRDSITYIIAVLILILFISDGQITFMESALMVSAYLAYIVFIFATRNHFPEAEDPIEEFEQDVQEIAAAQRPLLRRIAIYLLIPVTWTFALIPDVQKRPKYTFPVFALSLVLIAGMSYFLVDSAQVVATVLDIPASIIALTILAGGTSIPELISSAIVSTKGKADMAIANAIGSNTFDILISLGLPLFVFTLISGGAAIIPDTNIVNSLWLLLIVTIGVIGILFVQKFRMTRLTGVILTLVYVGFMIATVFRII